ncbi:MAG: hypothetical protein ABW123_02710 [Cystobacter sp.]
MLWAAAIRAVFLLLFGVLAFLAFVAFRGTGRFVSAYFTVGSFLLPLLVPAFVFIRATSRGSGRPRVSTASASLAAGLALLVSVMPVPGLPSLVLDAVFKHLGRGYSTTSAVTERVLLPPLKWVGHLFDECRRPGDCSGGAIGSDCAFMGVRNVCVTKTRALPSGCPPEWRCVWLESDDDLDGSSVRWQCIPAEDASGFKASNECRGRDASRGFERNSVD